MKSAQITITNFQIENGKFYFDIEISNTGKEEIYPGVMSLVFDFETGGLEYPFFRYFNERYITEDYEEPEVFIYPNNKRIMMLQLKFSNNATGIGTSMNNELLCTVESNLPNDSLSFLKWRLVDCGVVTRSFEWVFCEWNGEYVGMSRNIFTKIRDYFKRTFGYVNEQEKLFKNE